jgi:hypothetical protein
MNTKEFIQANQFLKDRIDQGIDIYPSDDEAKQFQTIAKTIDPERYFTLYGCQSCIVELVKFVFDNWKEVVKVKGK